MRCTAPITKSRTRRGFTLLELILASVLGAVVVLASYSLMAALTATDARTKQRTAASTELSRAHQVFRKAFASIVVRPPAPRQPNSRSGAVASAASTQPKDAAAEEPVDVELERRRARVLLEPDPVTPGAQRLEMVVSEPPILAGADGTSLPGGRATWLSKTRGAFEQRPNPSGKSIDLYWVIYPLRNEEELSAAGGRGATNGAAAQPTDENGNAAEAAGKPELEAAVGSAYLDQSLLNPDTPIAELLVARDLERCNIRLVRSGADGKVEPLTEARIATEEELPAYLELDIATMQGQRGTWMFEVGWTVDSRRPTTGRGAVADALRGRDGNGNASGAGGARSGGTRSGTRVGTGTDSGGTKPTGARGDPRNPARGGTLSDRLPGSPGRDR